MSELFQIAILAAETTASAFRDWFLNRFLGNLDLVALFGFWKLWSTGEHRRAQKELKETREKLAAIVAATAKEVASTSSTENAEILAEVKANTIVTEIAVEKAKEAFQEANSVNAKIAKLQEQQGDMT